MNTGALPCLATNDQTPPRHVGGQLNGPPDTMQNLAGSQMTDGKEEPELENSALSGDFSGDGITIRLEIYRLVGDEGWVLEAVDHEGTSTVWEALFATDEAAYTEFCRTVEEEGMKSFLETPRIRH
jgi:hypothetical protein